MARAALGMAAIVAMLLSLLAIVIPAPQAGAATTAFSSRFHTNDNGAILTIGNTLETCPSSAANCASGQAATTTGDDNDFNMVYVDTDNDASTFNSSSSDLSLPADATVLWAGLYWGARTSAGSGGKAGTGTLNQMSFKVAGAGAYQTITSQQQYGPVSGDTAYQQFADVTKLVGAAGSGTYWGANVLAGTGADRYAGWSLTVVYRSPSLPLRNLSVFDGFALVSSGNPQTITVNGFLAPKTAPVFTQLGMVAYEGDLGLSGDTATLDNTQLATPLSPGTNFFDSTDDNNGVNVTARNPAYKNMLGFDIKNVGASGLVPINSTSATIALTSSGDTYFPGVVTTAINLYAPDFTSSSKTAVDSTGNSPARPGDTIQYTLNYVNSGADPATNTVVTDALPANVTFVPGSMSIVSSTGQTTPLTDAAGDDQGEYDSSTRTVTARLGCGANATTGGTITSPSTTTSTPGCATTQTTLLFKVTLDTAAGGTTITNGARLTYTAQTSGVNAEYDVPPAQTPVAQVADVSLAKTVTPSPALAGGTITSGLTVVNNGPDPAQNVVVTDPLPAGQTPNAGAVTTGQGTCSVTATAVTCSLGEVAVGATVTITIPATTDSASTATSVTNVAQVTTTSLDPNQTNNTAAATVTLNRSADLSVSKTANPTSVVPGTGATFTVVVTNNGPSTAQAVSLNDLTGSAANLLLGTPTSNTAGVTCTAPTSGAAQCTIGTLGPGSTATITVPATVSSSATAGAQLPNTATVSSSTPDPDNSNNTSTATVTAAAPSADVRLTKAVSAPTLVAGGPVTYTIAATNFGPSDAQSVVVTDPLPSQIQITSATTSRGTCQLNTPASGTITCPVGTLPAGAPGQPGGSVSITLQGTVNSNAPAETQTDTATVTSSTADPSPGNNMASATAAYSLVSDLSVTKTADQTAVPPPGQTVTYTLTATNNGPSIARSATLTDAIPSELTLVSSRVVSTGAPCTQADPTHLSCSLGDLANGATATVLVTMQVPDPPPSGTVTEQVTQLTSGSSDPDPNNNTATWTLAPQPAADLAVTKTASPEPVIAGQPLTYSLSVINNGPGAAAGVAVTDPLPAATTFISAAPSSGTCTPPPAGPGGTLTCDVPTIADGATWSASVSVTVDPAAPPGSTITNQATVTSSTLDPTTSNNTDQVLSTVKAETDLAVTKSITQDPSAPNPPDGPCASTNAPGSCQLVTITLTNTGPSSAHNVTFDDTINTVDRVVFTNPDGTLVTNGASCALITEELQCTLLNPDGSARPDLAPGESATVTIPVQLTSSSAGTSTDTVTVATATPETNLANNDATAAIAVGPSDTALVVTKTPGPSGLNSQGQFTAGGPFAYQIQAQVPKGGPNIADAHGVVVTDVLPAGMTPTTVSTSQGTCSISGQTVTCDLGTVAGPYTNSGQPPPAVEITVSGTIDPDTVVPPQDSSAVVTNQATATTTTSDPGAACTTDAAGATTCTVASPPVDTTVVRKADLQLFKTADQNPMVAGGPAGYTITIVNAGPSFATNEIVTDTLPADITYDPTQTDPSAQCSVTAGAPATGQTVTCAPGFIPPDGSLSFRVVGTLDPLIRDGSVITNNAIVGGGPFLITCDPTNPATADPDCSNNSASVTTTVSRIADLSITSTVDNPTPALGGVVNFTVTVTNHGPSTGLNPIGTFTLPPGLTLTQADLHVPPLAACEVSPPAVNPVTVTCRSLGINPLTGLPTIAAGFGIAISGTAHVPVDIAPETITATGSIQSCGNPDPTNPFACPPGGNVDPDLSNNTTSVSIKPIIVADTSITKTLLTNPLVAGQPVTWRLTAVNHGPSIAPSVVFTDTLPAGTTFASASVEQGGGSCTLKSEDGISVIECDVATPLDVNQTASVLITVNTPASLTGSISNTGAIGSGGFDPNTPDNSATVTEPLPSDPAVTMSPIASPVALGAAAGYTATVKNNGPNGATNVMLTIKLPAGLNSPTASNPDCSIANQVLSCSLGTLAPNASLVITVNGTAAANLADGATLDATAAVSTDSLDTNTDNDQATASILVQQENDPNVAITAITSPVAAGSAAGYDVTVDNKGPNDAPNFVLTVDLPQGLNDPKVSGGFAPACQPITDLVLTCNLGTLHPDPQTVTVNGVSAANLANGTVLTATAAVTADPHDLQPANNRATASIVVRQLTNPAVAITPISSHATPGSPDGYTVTVVNDGPGPSNDTVLTVDIPPGLTSPSFSLNKVSGDLNPSCSIASGALTCSLGTMAASDQVVLTLDGTAAGSLANGTGLLAKASVTTSGDDSDPANNQATAVIVVQQTLTPSTTPPPTTPPAGGLTGTPTGTGTGVPSSPGAAPPAAPEAAAPTGPLAITGIDIVGMVAGAGVLIAGGVALRLSATRRRQRH